MRTAHVCRLASAALVATAVAVAAISCTEKIAPPEPEPPVATTDVVPDSVQSIFTAHCAVPFCHVSGAAFGGEILAADVAYQTTVNVPSTELPSMMRIRPFQPDSSYLVKKVRGDTDVVPSLGGQMPLGGPALSPAEIATLSGWVAAGAPPTKVPVAVADLLP